MSFLPQSLTPALLRVGGGADLFLVVPWEPEACLGQNWREWQHFW